MIPLSIPNFKGNESKYVNDAVTQGWVSTGGAYVTKLEEQLEQYLKTTAVAACQSGTSAIHLSMIECNIMPSDHVIVPTLTFIAAVNPVKYQFAAPIFMDCDDSLCIDPVKLQRFCEEKCDFDGEKLIYKQTKRHIKAIVVVHVFGNLADMELIMQTAKKYNLKVIEDATEALGTYYTGGKYKNEFAGTIGDFGAYSFNGNKIITTGGGGAVTSKDENVAKHMKYLSTQAKDDAHFYIHEEVGYNYRMTNLQGALGAAQLEELEEFIKRKNENYEIYKELLSDNKNLTLLPFREKTRSNKWFYSIKVNLKNTSKTIKEIIEKLADKGIQARPIWGLIHEQKPYRLDALYEIEKAKEYSQSIINVPCSTNITKTEIKKVTKSIQDLLQEGL